ncbi:hemerythrin domain-containing protein [Neobacillus drentensis]|uniref:hemerythrin domain-containing protein n=1 Tax=Neobacillus drentensis TaxID=220684 RepID=UPI001F40B1FE|nr:hemerythrin domain-containing protein [Neobacillus drentensis]ULT59315.1 hemerythrin domain-containing protein [Neobacillus drentensis]
MSGPSLRKQDAHTSIHESALNEAIDLRMLLQKCLTEDQKEKAIKVAEVTIEHWESRTLQHAASEEEGLYKEMVAEHPSLHPIVLQLTRDHDLMRRMVEQMKNLLIHDEIDERMVSLLDSLIIVDSIHNEDEMNKLLSYNESYTMEILEKGEDIA